VLIRQDELNFDGCLILHCCSWWSKVWQVGRTGRGDAAYGIVYGVFNNKVITGMKIFCDFRDALRRVDYLNVRPIKQETGLSDTS
jgi:hypothetical protein